MPPVHQSNFHLICQCRHHQHRHHQHRHHQHCHVRRHQIVNINVMMSKMLKSQKMSEVKMSRNVKCQRSKCQKCQKMSRGRIVLRHGVLDFSVFVFVFLLFTLFSSLFTVRLSFFLIVDFPTEIQVRLR